MNDNTNLKKIIGARIQDALTHRQKKQKDLADHLGVTPNTISYFCKGKRMPNTEQIYQISEYLNVPTDYLFGKVKMRNPQIMEDNFLKICQQTGLSADTIELFKQLDSFSFEINNGDFTMRDAITLLLNNNHLKTLCINIVKFKNLSNHYISKVIEELSYIMEDSNNINLFNLDEEMQDLSEKVEYKKYKTAKTFNEILVSSYCSLFDEARALYNTYRYSISGKTAQKQDIKDAQKEVKELTEKFEKEMLEYGKHNPTQE